MTHSRFPSPANDYIEDSIDLNREFVPSPMSTEQLVVVGDAMRGVGLYDGDLVLFDRAKLPTSKFLNGAQLNPVTLVNSA